jgi:serine acetyltransferase
VAHGETQRTNAHALTGDRTAPRGVRQAVATYVHAVNADFQLMRRGRAKYLGDSIGPNDFPGELVKRIGLQMMVAIRTMHLLRDAGFTRGSQVASRLIRHAYGAEIHPQSQWAPGVNLVHGNGLVVGSGARVGAGCVLLQNVTLGDAFDQATGRIGGPQLGENVHIGPGCTVIGPVSVGRESKLMAGAMLEHSVPARSLVRAAPAVVSHRPSERERDADDAQAAG